MSYIDEALLVADAVSVDVIMRQPLPFMPLIQGSVGPVAALQKTTLPLWLAILLRRQERCTVLIPSWLSREILQQWVNDERSKASALAPLPWHWYSLGTVLLNEANSDFAESPLDLLGLLSELYDIRSAKTRRGLLSMDSHYLNLTGLGQLEIASLKPLVAPAMKKLSNLSST